MQELSGSGLRSMEGFRSLAGSSSTAMEAANPRPSSDTGEKPVDEQASVTTDLEMALVKLRRATEQINLLEGKLQQAVNENAKLKVKQTEDSKLWQGLDSKLSSPKSLCDQLTETLQQLPSQTEQGRQEMLQIKQEKEEMDQSYKERLHSDDATIKEKDSLIKQLEGSVDENKSRLICLDSRLQCMEQELKLNDDVCISLKEILANSESEKNSLELMNKGHILEIERLCRDNKDLKELLSSFMVKVTELDKEHASVSSHVSRLISSFERFYEMAQEEKMLMERSSKDKFEHLRSQYVDLTPENNALKTEIEELLSRLIELQTTKEFVMVQYVEECQVAEDKIRRLESEVEVSASNINKLEKLAFELQGRIQKLLEDSTLAENHKLVKLRRATEQINLLVGKLQQAVNENAKLKVKQTEDSKLWQGLDSKLSSTKPLCDQLTETLQQLPSQTEQAEEDKKFFEEMLGKNSKYLDECNCLLRDLSTKLKDAEQMIISGRQEMLQIKQEKEEMDQSYKERLHSDDATIKEKNSLIKQLEGSVDENKSRLICLDSRLRCMVQELKLNDDVCISLKEILANSESEKNSLELMNKEHILEIERLCRDNKDLKELLSSFMVKVTELDKEHASVSSHVSRLISSFERFYEMAQEEKMLMARSSKDKFEHLQGQYVDLTPENNALKTEIEELLSRLIELQITQEIVMVQHVEECQVAEDKIRRLESEAEVSASNINKLEKSASELEGRIQKLLEDSTLAENHKQKMLQKILNLESDNQELLGQVQSIMEEKSNNAESLQGDMTKRDQQVHTLENQINQLRSVLDEKEQLYRCSVEREKTLEDQKLQVKASLSATECQLSEAKKQYDLMLEGEKIELSKQLKELSLKNDQVINEIRKKYELEKIEITNAEKEKAEKLIREIENKCNEKISQNKYDSERYLIWLKEEHGTMVERIQQDNEHKESTLWAYHKEELQRIQSHAEIKLRERLSLLRKEHELQMKSLRMHHEEECQRMQEELELQKSKEENQRALLQLQWKVLGGSQQVDQEVNSKKQVDDVWDKRQIMYVLVLTTTASLVFLLQPLLPVAYSRWIILVIAVVWGLGSIGLPFGLYGTSKCEREFSRHTSRLVYTLFSVLVIYGFYLVAMRTGDTSASTSSLLLKEGATDINDNGWTVWFFIIGLIVLIGNIWSSIRGCWTGGDRDT